MPESEDGQVLVMFPVADAVRSFLDVYEFAGSGPDDGQPFWTFWNLVRRLADNNQWDRALQMVLLTLAQRSASGSPAGSNAITQVLADLPGAGDFCGAVLASRPTPQEAN